MISVRVPALVMFGLAMICCSIAAVAAETEIPPTAIATGELDAEGNPLYAMPAVVVTDRDGKQIAYPILENANSNDGVENSPRREVEGSEPTASGVAQTSELTPIPNPTLTPDPDRLQPSSWYKMGFGALPLPSAGISTTDWISANLTVVVGTFKQRAVDQRLRLFAQENNVTGPSITGELGHSTRKIGVGVSSVNFATVFFIIPIPIAVSWSAHAVLLHAGKETRGFDGNGSYAGVEGKLGGAFRLAWSTVTAGAYRKITNPTPGSGLSYRLGAGIGF